MHFKAYNVVPAAVELSVLDPNNSINFMSHNQLCSHRSKDLCLINMTCVNSLDSSLVIVKKNEKERMNITIIIFRISNSLQVKLFVEWCAQLKIG